MIEEEKRKKMAHGVNFVFISMESDFSFALKTNEKY